ncbi:hypothetical protein ACV242_000932 [Peribacillus simplex]
MDNQLNLNGGNNQGMAMDSVILDISPSLRQGLMSTIMDHLTNKLFSFGNNRKALIDVLRVFYFIKYCKGKIGIAYITFTF